MAGGVGTVTRQMRNTFRGVKKDMLQRQTTLYLQNMTVSIVNIDISFVRDSAQCVVHTTMNLQIL
jgi:hypothetical protein